MLDKKKILEMYAYYFGVLGPKGLINPLTEKLSYLNLSRGVLQRGYKEIKELGLDFKLVEFLYLVDLMYILLIAKECGATKALEIARIIKKMDKQTKDNFMKMLIFTRASGTKKSADKIIKRAFNLVFGEKIKDIDEVIKLRPKQFEYWADNTVKIIYNR